MTRMMLLCLGVCVASAAGSVCVAQTTPHPGLDEVRIDVVNKRLPILEAVKQVERRFGRVVTYEDVPHVAPSDLVDITDQVAKGKALTTRIYLSRSDSIRLAYTSRYATLDAQAGEALAKLLAVWNGGDHSGKFRVERVAGGYHVIPVARRGLDERTEPYTSPLDTRITVPTAERDGVETLTVLVQAVAESSGRVVHVGRIPHSRLTQTRVTIGAKHQTAREVLWGALQAMDPALSWLMTCDVGEDAECGIHIYPLGQL
jgi:hypothetical protein